MAETLTFEHGQVEAYVVRFRDPHGREQVLLTHEAWKALGYPEGITVTAVPRSEEAEPPDAP